MTQTLSKTLTQTKKRYHKLIIEAKSNNLKRYQELKSTRAQNILLVKKKIKVIGSFNGVVLFNDSSNSKKARA